ncbi:MAG: electron transfer flavoprotein-ubiquinone oxidoreductase [Chlorobium phaeobacteroides]|uniref:Electron transfer flavoprotein-ubiquinone oxidoreductase n=1 Tax=Chlorobium phaeobacteroides (strain BS1) TaxID=331678 RepID=B3EN10_CHLPB|nr:electron transfer flavoprotein-ubiquinone oxidoreductase [Chlorobium phaeobacteroides]MBL6955369.1 electron transfer flavoprotein-ubiquinone oxidoreductase [Chlorobium phaeobacteroides]
MQAERESLDFDIVFVGAGPANLTAAIDLQRLINRHNASATTILEPEIAILEKGRYVGAHLLSGAILDPAVFNQFMPDFLQRGCPLEAEVTRDSAWFLFGQKKIQIPYLPEPFRNRGNRLVSLSKLGAWLAGEAESLGINIFDNTAAVEPVIENGRVTGVITDDKGIDKAGNAKSGAEPGMRLNAKTVVVGEGSHGSIFRKLDRAFALSEESRKQIYETGVKEFWKIPEGRIEAGEVRHTFGYPLPSSIYGGGWLYAFSDTEVSLGFVTSAEPERPEVDSHYNLQLFKQHPFISSIIRDGQLMEFGAKTITSGGFHAMPKPSGPGFLLTGETAGLVNMQRLKGLHLAMQSGIMAAETLFASLLTDDFSEKALHSYRERLENSEAYKEMHMAGNYRQAFENGLYTGLMQAGLSLKIPGLLPSEKAAASAENKPDTGKKHYLKWIQKKAAFRPDDALTFSKSTDLYASGTVHEEDQPCHLLITTEDITDICLKKCTEAFGNPCQHFCPAGVYEINHDADPFLRLSPSNCLHCKTCEIIDPYGSITWVPPEGGGGPGYRSS